MKIFSKLAVSSKQDKFLKINETLSKIFPFWEHINGITLKFVGMKRLNDAKKKHADIRSPLNSWINEVEEAEWKGPQDVKERYASASFIRDNQIYFNIKGNSYRLLVQVDYSLQLVVIKWIGTHAEYTQKNAKDWVCL